MANNPIRDLSPAYTTPGTRRNNAAVVVDSAGLVNALDVTTLSIAGTALTASAAELNRVADASARIVSITAASDALTAAEHDGKIITLNRAGGIDLTLPAATGSGLRFLLIVGTAVSGDSYTVTVVDTCNDTINGNIMVLQDGGSTLIAFESGSAAVTLTMNATTTGGVVGDWFELVDIAADTWWVRGVVAGTGCEATPFS